MDTPEPVLDVLTIFVGRRILVSPQGDTPDARESRVQPAPQ